MLVESKTLNRRNFIHYASAAFVLPVVGLGAVQLAGCAGNRLLAHSTSESDKTTAGPWSVRIASESEPGVPLIVSGTIFAPDERTPVEGINLFVYQTDATGVYSSNNNGDHRNTRIHGQMRTNAEGRYEFRTIRPASYPGTRNPAHIHAYLSGPGYPEYWIDEYLFDDDPLVTETERQKHPATGTFASILKVTRRADGVLTAVRDIKLERCTRNCTGR
jgi:protocatechuate 3,4-dioxygenase, beta subunit